MSKFILDTVALFIIPVLLFSFLMPWPDHSFPPKLVRSAIDVMSIMNLAFWIWMLLFL